MEPFTLSRKFLQQDQIDVFHSMIWTERYYGNSEVELVVPLTVDSLKKLSTGMFLGIPESKEVMILETMVIEKNTIKFTGMSLLPWLNNRFIRGSHLHSETGWTITPAVPGEILWQMVRHSCHHSSQWLDGTVPIGIPNPQTLIIPGLELKDYDKSGTIISPVIKYGPVYDALLEIATAHEIGMQITLESATESSYTLGFRSYRGLNRTSLDQNVRPPIRFSVEMDSLVDITELKSIAALKTWVYSFAPNVTNPVPTAPGQSKLGLTDPEYAGFDLRAHMILVDEITNDSIDPPGDAARLLNLLNNKANETLIANPTINAVDGEIVPTSQFQYGRDYNLGDIIEIEGLSGIISRSRVTEYIRAHDEAGEKSYPTVTALD